MNEKRLRISLLLLLAKRQAFTVNKCRLDTTMISTALQSPIPHMLNSFGSTALHTDLLTNIYTDLHEMKLFRYNNDTEDLSSERSN